MLTHQFSGDALPQWHSSITAVPTYANAPPTRPLSAVATGYQIQQPTQASIRSPLASEFRRTVASVEQPYRPSVQDATQVSRRPFSQAPTALRIIQPDELLQPQYDWMDAQLRHITNAKITSVHVTVNNESLPYEHRLGAHNALIQVTAQISMSYTRHLKLETAKRNIHRELPKLWKALKTRFELPAGHAVHEAAGNYLMSTMSCLDPTTKSYAQGIIEKMIRTENEGRDALELIPGYLPPHAPHEDMPVQWTQQESLKPQSSAYASVAPAWASSPPQAESSSLPDLTGL
jgi:hypothetical protein